MQRYLASPIAATGLTLFAVLLLAFAATFLVGRVARAQEPVDISGDWTMTLALDVSGNRFGTTCLVWIAQESASLRAAIACVGDGAGGRLTGTIDNAGAFSLSGSIADLHHDFSGTFTSKGGGRLSGTFTVVPTGHFQGVRSDFLHWGDFDCRGGVGALDVLNVLQRSAKGIGRVYDGCGAFTDVNVDGHIDPIDALLILQYEAGLMPRLPVL